MQTRKLLGVSIVPSGSTRVSGFDAGEASQSAHPLRLRVSEVTETSSTQSAMPSWGSNIISLMSAVGLS